jgi:hypothetical protein
MIIINFSKPFSSIASFLSITALITIKVVYDHTRIASYQHWSSESARATAQLAGGLSSGPFCPG